MKQVQVFISYRRDDSALTATVLHDALRARPDIFSVFMDVNGISYGDNFVAVIDRELNESDVVLVLIGSQWSEMLQARLRGDDWVRHEVATALALRVPDDAEPAQAKRLRVLPILIGGASPPVARELPVDLAALPRISMLTFDARAKQASINTLLETILGETFEQRAKRLAEEAAAERQRLLEEQRRMEEERRRLVEEQRLQERDRRRRFWALVGSAAAGVALFVANISGLLDLLTLDTRVASATMLLAGLAAPQEAPWSGDVVLVGIDPDSEKALQRKFDPSWRAEHAKLIGNAAAAAARVVAFDMVLEDAGPDDANAALERALAETRNKMPVVFGVQTRADNGGGLMLARFAPLARRGINCAGETLGQARSMPLAVQRNAPAASASMDAASAREELTPSFALAAFSGGGRVELLDEIEQTATVRLRPQRKSQTVGYYVGETVERAQSDCDVIEKGDRVVSQLIDPFTLPALRSPPRRVAYEKVVAGDPATLALLKNRIVLVGNLLPGKDVVTLPWFAGDRWRVELIAVQVDAMARDVAIRPIDPIVELLLTSAMGLLGAITVHRLRARPRAMRIVVLLSIAAAFIIAVIAWYRSEHQLISVPYGLIALGLGAWLARRTMRGGAA